MCETVITFARVCLPGVETAIAFAGEKRAFLACFSVAVAMSVSTVAGQGRAVVMVVSCWPASVVAEVSLVASSPRHSCPCEKKFALLGLMVGVSATKFAQRTKNGPKSVVCGVLGEFFHGNAGGRAVLGEFYRDPAAVGARGRTLLHRGPGGWASLLAVLTLQCAVKPYWWHGGQPAHAATYRVNVRVRGV